VVENIPKENFDEEQVRGFFAQFGDIVDVSMMPKRSLAIITYDTWDSAHAAWASPKVIFDNRFVKVYWHRPSLDSRGEAEAGAEGEEPEFDMAEFMRKQDEAQRQHEERMAKKAELDRKKEELEQLQRELHDKHSEERRRLQQKLAQTGRASSLSVKSEEGGSGSASEALRAQLAALEEEAKTLGIDTNAPDESQWGEHSRGGWSGYRARGPYRGGYRGRGRGAYRGRADVHLAYAAHSLDNRPKVVAISGEDFTAPAKYEGLRHYLVVSLSFV
jgi:hypothetical protein